MSSPNQVLRELITSAILWRKTKAQYLKLSDSKTAPPDDVTAARKAHMAAVHRLDSAVLAFEKLGLLKKPKGKAIPWKKVIDGLAVGLSTLSKATDASAPNPPMFVESKVIDMPMEK